MDEVTYSLHSGFHVPLATIIASAAFMTAGLYVVFVPNSIIDRRRAKLPPGPRGWPVLGNLLDFSDSEKVRGNVQRWAREYGDVFHTKMGGTDYIWLSSPRAVKDLMDKKSAIYSSRPFLPLAQNVASGKSRQLFMAYGPEWRGLRRHSHTLLNQVAANSYRPVQDFESKVVLMDLLTQPDDFVTIIRRYTTSVIMLVTYGYRIPSFDDPLITKIFKVLEHAGTFMAPGAFAVESFPSLTVLPEFLLGNWYTWGKNAFAHDSKVYLDLWKELKRKTDEGNAQDCFCKDFYLTDPEKNGVNELLAAFTCGGLVEAGSETTATTVINWLLAMLLNPHVLKKAQDEIDAVVGSDRLPVFEDEQDLPYVRAMIKETLRWRPLNKYGMYHAATEDDWYEGCFIPKDSVVVLNWWAIHRDPDLFEDPDSFKPERYLSKPLAAAAYINTTDPYDRDHFAYGAGRRVCPGVHLAERSLFIVVARILWGFDLTKKKGPDGLVLEPTIRMVPGFFSSAEKFECDIKVRSATHEKVIRQAFNTSQEEGLCFRSSQK